MSDTAMAEEPRLSLFREDVTEAQKDEFLALAHRVEAQMRRAGIHLETADAFEANRQELRIEASFRVAISTLLRDCTRLGPPSPIGYANDETGALILVCGHPTQHRYGLDGTPLN